MYIPNEQTCGKLNLNVGLLNLFHNQLLLVFGLIVLLEHLIVPIFSTIYPMV